MKKITRFIAPIALSAAVLLPSVASAYNIKGGAGIPSSLTLTKESALYNVDGSGPSGAALAPQNVTVIGYVSSPVGSMNISFVVDTWIGPKIVSEIGATLNFPPNDLVGKTVELKKTTTDLYDMPNFNYKMSWASLAPQSVKIVGGNGTYVAIETFVGQKWIDIRDFQ